MSRKSCDFYPYSLHRAVEAKKRSLVEKSKKSGNKLTDLETSQLEYFRNRGSTYLLTAAIGKCLETFLDRRIPNLFRLSFGEDCSPQKAQDFWKNIIEATSPFCQQLKEAFTDGLKNMKKVQQVIKTFQSLVQATALANADTYSSFKKHISITKTT